MKRIFATLFIFATAFTAPVTVAEQPRVAVLVDEALPVLGGAPALQPFKAAEALRRHGLAVTELSAVDLADPEKLNVAKFPVLVLWNVDAFPAPAFTNLRAFHAAGGFLSCSTVWHSRIRASCVEVNGSISGIAMAIGTRPRAWGPEVSLGRGNRREHLIVPENPLGLKQATLPSSEAKLQWFEPGKLHDGDSLLPLIQVRTDDGKTHDAAVILRHECSDFRGARDIWLGQAAGGRDEDARYLAEQLLVRGVFWLLRERELVSDDEWNRQRAALDRIEIPGPLPSGLAYHETPRPWGDTFLPKSKPPARHLLAIELGKLTPAERIAVTCLQGLHQPRAAPPPGCCATPTIVNGSIGLKRRARSTVTKWSPTGSRYSETWAGMRAAQ